MLIVAMTWLRWFARSADRRSVLDAALVPKLIEAAGDLQRRTGADVAIEGFAVVADRLDDPDHPILGQAELFAEIAVCPERALLFRFVGFRHLVDIRKFRRTARPDQGL